MMKDSMYFMLISMVMIAPHVREEYAICLGLVWFLMAIWKTVGEVRAE